MMNPPNRRFALHALLAATALPAMSVHAQTTPDLTALLRTGGCAVMLRHAQTVSGIGDPPGFKLDQCSTQRNLNDDGREQSKRIGQWFKTRGLNVSSVQSSAWCRCKDTADLAFGRHTVLPALNSFFEDRNSQTAQTQQLRQRLQTIQAGQFEVWVTHQVNISALTQEFPAMGEAFIVNRNAQLLGRTLFTS